MKILVPSQLETERLVLRQLDGNDWQSLHKYYSDPIATQYTTKRQFSEIESWYVVCSMIGHWQIRGYGPYAIEQKENKRVVGIAGFWYPLDWPGPEIKWALARDYWGQGFAVEAAEAVLAAGRKSLTEISWVSFIHDENAASMRLAKTIGGLCRDRRHFNGAWWQVYVY